MRTIDYWHVPKVGSRHEPTDFTRNEIKEVHGNVSNISDVMFLMREYFTPTGVFIKKTRAKIENNMLAESFDDGSVVDHTHKLSLLRFLQTG